MRVTSAFWVSAFVRRCNQANIYAVVQRKGAAESGAIWIVLDNVQGGLSLFSPAPSALAAEQDSSGDTRLFLQVMDDASAEAVRTRLDKEQRFDSDMWVVEIESRDKQHFIPLVKNG